MGDKSINSWMDVYNNVTWRCVLSNFHMTIENDETDYGKKQPHGLALKIHFLVVRRGISIQIFIV